MWLEFLYLDFSDLTCNFCTVGHKLWKAIRCSKVQKLTHFFRTESDFKDYKKSTSKSMISKSIEVF